jgi:hypothetical protein
MPETALTRKLGISPGCRLILIDVPAEVEQALAPLPDGVRVHRRLGVRGDVILFCCAQGSRLERRLPSLVRALEADGGLWLAWPKRSSGVPSDLSDDVVRDLGLRTGLVDNKVCAIDATWSALRFVVRLRDRG